MSNLGGTRFVWHRFCCMTGNIELKKSSEKYVSDDLL